MNEIDILKKLSSNLTERKSTAALSNYLVLSNNISFLNKILRQENLNLQKLQDKIITNLEIDSKINSAYNSSTDNFFVIPIFKRIIQNSSLMCFKIEKIMVPDNRENISIKNVWELGKDFEDYNELVTTVRQFIDNIVTDSYSIIRLEPKLLNYTILVSLNSFKKYATKSLINPLFNNDVKDVLHEFEQLKYRDWKKSQITECQHDTFSEKIDYFNTELNIDSIYTNFSDEIKNLFKFSSEFTHIGYVSTFFSSSKGAEVIFGDKIGPYLPSTENFNELKYQLLESVYKLLITIYLPSLKKALDKIFIKTEYSLYENIITKIINSLKMGLSTRNNEYYFFIQDKVLKSSKTICLKCMCNTITEWKAPHDNSELFCESCGSSFKLISLSGDPKYIQTDKGFVKVIDEEDTK